MRLRPETKNLVLQANRLLAIWQEQEKTVERVWDEQGAAHKVWIGLMENETATAEELRAAYKKWRACSEFAQKTDRHYDTQREWVDTKRKAERALAEDAGLLRSEEEKSWDDPCVSVDGEGRITNVTVTSRGPNAE